MNARPLHARTSLLIGGATLAALLLAGCGASSGTSSGAASTATGGTKAAPSSPSSAGPAATGPHNDQDVGFATDMLPHHAQAVEMADMALSRPTDRQVVALATQIKAAQAPEIRIMSGWLTGWGEPVPAAAAHDMAGMSDSRDTMMSVADMTTLDAAGGTTFARLWLTGMMAHHEGAVAMARTELASGQNTQAKALAGSIVASQSKELVTMTAVLRQLA